MLILFAGTNDGWGNYVINGTRKKPRNHEKVKVLKGDITLGDHITNHPNYRQNAYSIILSFKGKPAIEVMEKVLTEFEQLFMHGFEAYEYHFDAVLHMDTDDYHIHVRIPKFNLYTETQLQLYLDKKDRYRVNLIRNLIDMKYHLESPKNNRQFIREEQGLHTTQWKKSNKQESRKMSRSVINNFIRELHQASLINSLSDVKNVLEDANLKIINTGYDYSRDLYYITVQNKSKKIKLTGDIYSEYFWKYSRENREKQIADNKQFRGSYKYSPEEYKRVSIKLYIVLEKRSTEINARYRKPRERAAKRLDNLQQKSQESIIHKTKSFKNEGAATSHTNFRDSDTHTACFTDSELPIQRTTNTEQVAHSKSVQVESKRWTVYSYTIEKSELLEKKQHLLLKIGGLNGRINKNIIRKNSQDGKERTSIDKFDGSEQEELYKKAKLYMQRMAQTRDCRERYRKKIAIIGKQCVDIKQDFNSSITKINTIIRTLAEETTYTGVKIDNNRELTIPDYVDELLEWGRQPF